MRSFIGIKVPEIQQYRDLLEKLSLDFDVKISITSPEKYHFTLHFFGEITELDAVEITDLMKNLELESFNLSVKEPGSIPEKDLSKTRVLYLHPNYGRDQLVDLSMKIRKILSRNNFEVPRRNYLPHLTVARIRRGSEILKLTNEWMRQEFEEIDIEVTKFHLIKSELHSSGARYSTLSEFSLS